MRWRLTGIGLGVVAAIMVLANPVKTLGQVGFTKLTFESGKLYLVSVPFDVGSALKATDVFGTQLPVGTTLDYYDGVTPYLHDMRTVKGWSSNITFNAFMGVWLRLPQGPTISPSYEVAIPVGGQVAEEFCYLLKPGLNMVAYPYPIDIAFTNTQLYAGSVSGDQLHIFNSATTNYGSFTRTVGGWPAPAKAIVFKTAGGFWYKNNGPQRAVCEPHP